MLSTALISVAIGVGLALVFSAGGYGLQLLIAKASAALAPGLMIASLMVRLMVLVAVVVPLVYLTDLNIIALLVAFAVLFTILQAVVVTLQVKKAKAGSAATKNAEASEAGPVETTDVSKEA